MKGKFIVLEGGEGSGKSTQAKLLASTLNDRGIETFMTREPGGSEGAERIRKLLVEGDPGVWDGKTELLLFNAARRDHIAKVIMPAMVMGKWVICDRYVHSTIAYQHYGRDSVSLDILLQTHREFCLDLWPHLTIIFDVPIEIGHSRFLDRTGKNAELSRFEKADREFHSRVRFGYLQIAKSGHIVPRDSPTAIIYQEGRETIDDIRGLVTDIVTSNLPECRAKDALT